MKAFIASIIHISSRYRSENYISTRVTPLTYQHTHTHTSHTQHDNTYIVFVCKPIMNMGKIYLSIYLSMPDFSHLYIYLIIFISIYISQYFHVYFSIVYLSISLSSQYFHICLYQCFNIYLPI